MNSIRYVKHPHRLRQRLRAEWELRGPRRGPRYSNGTPRIEGSSPLEAFFPPNAPTLAAAALSYDAADFVMKVLGRLTPSDESEKQEVFYLWGRAKYGQFWQYADITTTLRAAALFVRPRTYLEIGLRRGRSAAVVAATCPSCDMYGFDLWIPDYGDTSNPGPEFVRAELQAVGHAGKVTLVSGDSKKTVPMFLEEQPQLYFDLIAIDGDHSVPGAMADLIHTLPRLKVGGVLVFDDICSAPLLMRVWELLVRRDSRFVTWEYTSAGYGVAAAIRISDSPALAGLE